MKIYPQNQSGPACISILLQVTMVVYITLFKEVNTRSKHGQRTTKKVYKLQRRLKPCGKMALKVTFIHRIPTLQNSLLYLHTLSSTITITLTPTLAAHRSRPFLQALYGGKCLESILCLWEGSESCASSRGIEIALRRCSSRCGSHVRKVR